VRKLCLLKGREAYIFLPVSLFDLFDKLVSRNMLNLQNIPGFLRNLKKILGLFLIASLASGCQSLINVKPVATEPDLVSERIAKAAETASLSLNDISGIEQQRTPAPAPVDYTTASDAMIQPITLRWSGPAEQIVQTLSSRAGFSFRTKGNPPPVALTVTIDVYQQPIVEVLHSIGLQLGQRADLAVNGRTNVIEIRYAPADK
jgi:defect in organelle trafficking protein DotD